MKMNLCELLQKLKDFGGLDAIEEFFKQNAFKVNKDVPGVVGIKYIEGINQIWRARWAREARGRFYYIGGEKVIPIKDTLQRGIEVLTKAHLDGGITETQDVNEKSLEKLDDAQRIVMKSFSGDNEFKGFVTGKVDGSLLVINIYPKDSEQYPIITKLVEEYGDEFTKTIVGYCINRFMPIITISTQGTLFISEDMQDYFLTAFQAVVDCNTCEDTVPYFVEKVMNYYQDIHDKFPGMLNMCFEAYCKNRLTIGGRFHSELAVGYDHNGFIFLGMMWNGMCVPHFDLPKKVFMQPFYYAVSNTKEVYKLMKELDDVVLGKKIESEFLTNFSIDELTSRSLHSEGFVLLTPFNGEYDYAKVKTRMYYACHKVKMNKIKEMLELPESCFAYYPILRTQYAQFFRQ
jgi:hypothetical protein